MEQSIFNLFPALATPPIAANSTSPLQLPTATRHQCCSSDIENLFKEIHEFVSFHHEPLSPYSSDSDSSSNSSPIPSLHLRLKKVKLQANVNLKDPSDDKLFQMLARGGNRKKSYDRSSNLGTSGSKVQRKRSKTTIKDDNDSTLTNQSSPVTPLSHHQHQHQHLQQQLQLQLHQYQNQQHAVASKSALVQFKSLHISDKGSYFNSNLDKGLAKYPNYFDFVDSIKKPFKQLEDLTCDSSGSDHVDTDFNPQSPSLPPDILAALNSCLFPSVIHNTDTSA